MKKISEELAETLTNDPQNVVMCTHKKVTKKGKRGCSC